MDWILEKIGQMEIANLLAVAGIVWFLLRPIKKDVEDIKKDVAAIEKDVREIDRRVSRIEGILMNKDCCMIKDSRNAEKE